MINIIKVLQDYDHYGIGDNIEIAKGKHELVTRWSDITEKIKRLWLLRKK
jgi:hypothetical protein